ncbi:MAG TPA: UvrD-helicase domain-containing protein [Bacteroidia bacterium]|jgi:ATP-dependent exoDNAse (exonuclease V) beta subunit|nr:UvrD-helicase domain-containing protein [Bacteroidia bacterium]
MNFTVYRSSAGSGKTYTLVREYLLLALADVADPPQRYREILAITFTNKAAAEMKERIIRYLGDLSHLQNEQADPFAASIMHELKIDRLTLVSRAKDVLKAILHNYGDFAVGTIDAFTHRIVRAFAYDLDLPVNFEVETDDKRLIREAVDILISRIGEDEKLTEVLVKFSEAQAEEEKSWQLETQIRKISENLLKEEEGMQAEKLRSLSIDDFLQIRDVLSGATRTFEKKVVDLAEKAMAILEQNNIAVDDLFKGKYSIAEKVGKLRNGKIEDFDQLEDRLAAIRSAKNVFSGSAPKEKQELITNVLPSFLEYCERIIATASSEFGDYIVRKQVLKNLFALSVLNEVEKIIHSFRDEEHIIHISAFNRLIADVVLREPVPFIFERLGEKYRNYLIDEFQDTSVVQWQNLLPLVENSLAGNNFSMLVGDGKQSIYRWRGGDVEQFASLPKLKEHSDNELVQQRVQSLVRNFKEEFLGMNYRSRSEIVAFNNSFFHKASQYLDEPLQIIYKSVEQQVKKENEGGYIELVQLGDEEDIQLRESVGLVKRLISEGWRAEDIAVISRRNTELNELATAFLQAGIPVLASESLLLRNSREVNFILCLLRSIDFPEDVLASTSALQFLSASGLIKNDLHHLLHAYRQSGKPLIDFLDANGFPLLQKNIASKNVYHRAEDIVEIFGLNRTADAFVLFFLDEILFFLHSRNSGLTDFFEWWDERSAKSSVIVPEGMNAVRLMTIHKSKGLEFPVVILPFADWKLKDNIDNKWMDYTDELVPQLTTVLVQPIQALDNTRLGTVRKNERSKMLLDLLNELYVAMTRPTDRLYMFFKAFDFKSEPDVNGVRQLIYHVTKEIGLEFNEGKLSIGSPGSPTVHKEKDTGKLAMKNIPSGNWEKRLMLRSASKEIWSDEKEKAKQKGKLIHKLLSLITKSSDIGNVVANALAEGWISSDESGIISEKLNAIVSDPLLADCFSGKTVVRREKEILLKSGKFMRPDLVVETGKELIILDYKTGKKEDRYRKQLDDYAEVLQEMGYSNIRKKIYYTESAEVDSW